MSRFALLQPDAFKKIQMNAGVLAESFDTSTGAVSGILGVTSGGINFTATPSFKDFGEDMDNVPKNTMELKRTEDVEVKASGTFATVDGNSVKMLIGGADVNGAKITPRMELAVTDFKDIWLVGDYSDDISEENGGYIAIHMLNALSTGGFQIQTADKDKGKFAFEFTGHFSYNSPNTIPFEVYIFSPTALTVSAERRTVSSQVKVFVTVSPDATGTEKIWCGDAANVTVPAIGSVLPSSNWVERTSTIATNGYSNSLIVNASALYAVKTDAANVVKAVGYATITSGSRTPTYTVTYDGNGADSGDVPVDPDSPYDSGDTVTVLGNTGTLVKTGKTFGGWNTAADGTGTAYAAEATFTISANTVLYAVWSD